MRVIVRAAGTIVYLGGTLLWAGLMALTAALRCDDSCTGPRYESNWSDNPDAWQYGVVGWLGLAGLCLSLVAIVLSWFRRPLGVAAFGAHLGVFTVNLVI